MAGSSNHQLSSVSEIQLSQLRDGGQRGYIVVKLIRIWDCIIPPTNIFTGIDFLALDSQGFAMHGTIPSDLADDFRPQVKEGRVYEIRIFEVGPRWRETQDYSVGSKADGPKYYPGYKQINSCSATKFYLDPLIPQAAELRAKFLVDGRPIDLISSADVDASNECTYPDAVNKLAQDLLYMNPAVIKFKVIAKVVDFKTGHGWYYTSCTDCTFAVKPTPAGYRCEKHGITPTRISLRVSLVLVDGDYKLQAIVFGNLAKRLTGIDVANLTVAEKLDRKNLPFVATEILGKDFDFVLGLADQTYNSGLNFKIFRFTPVTQYPPTDLGANKGKQKASSPAEIVEETETEVICTPQAPCETQASPVSTPAEIGSGGPEKAYQPASKKLKAWFVAALGNDHHP
ncbi:Nucleic acid-binding protein [Corchorus olitorius]|uniref:Nucleic acid-binding protein n=1 Tax=Corchorus olitorius TaxID=93759 RepID=A0A1R3H4U8_9ROSI|nr:Nucleic acid-binding protein [Corchorus olitorius]